MFAQAILVSLIPLLPVSAAIDPEDPAGPIQPPVQEAPEPPGPLSPPSYPPPIERDRRSAIYGTFGFGTPLGLVGIEGVHRLGSIFEITGGLGIGVSASGGQNNVGIGHLLQWAVMPRLRLGNDRDAFTAGAGVSGGNFGNVFSNTCWDNCGSGPAPTTYPVGYFLWSNFEIGWEHWTAGGFAVRLFGGYGRGWCVSTPCLTDANATLPYTGVGLGHAF